MVKLDDMDKQILMVLEKDARISYRKIAKDLGISVGTVHNRINKLKNQNVLKGYLLDLDESKLGYKLKFIILISVNGKYTAEVLEDLSNLPQVISIFHITGDRSAAMICRFQEMEEVQHFILELNKNPYILKTTSNMILQSYKDDKNHIITSEYEMNNDNKDKKMQSNHEYDSLKEVKNEMS